MTNNKNSNERPLTCKVWMICRSFTKGCEAPLEEWSDRHRNLDLSKQHLQETDSFAHSGIPNQNPSKRAGADQRLNRAATENGACLDRPHSERNSNQWIIYTYLFFSLKCWQQLSRRSWVTSRVQKSWHRKNIPGIQNTWITLRFFRLKVYIGFLNDNYICTDELFNLDTY